MQGFSVLVLIAW